MRLRRGCSALRAGAGPPFGQRCNAPSAGAARFAQVQRALWVQVPARPSGAGAMRLRRKVQRASRRCRLATFAAQVSSAPYARVRLQGVEMPRRHPFEEQHSCRPQIHVRVGCRGVAPTAKPNRTDDGNVRRTDERSRIGPTSEAATHQRRGRIAPTVERASHRRANHIAPTSEVSHQRAKPRSTAFPKPRCTLRRTRAAPGGERRAALSDEAALHARRS